MTSISTFKSRSDLSAEENMQGFIDSCRNELTVFGADLPFDSDTWDVTEAVQLKSQGAARHRLIFSNLETAGAPSRKNPVMMPEPFKTFAKAYMRYMFGLRRTKAINLRIVAFRVLELALTTRSGESDPMKLIADDFNRAASTAQQKYVPQVAANIGRTLESIANFLTEQRLTYAPVHWRNYLKNDRSLGRVGKEFDERRKSLLPSAAALNALPKIFRGATEDKDVFVTSITALLCASPDRINEVLHLPVDCEVEVKKDNGELAYGLRWWPSKGAEPMVKWIVPSMWGVVKEAIANIRRLTEPARKIAAWYDDNPGSLYLPEDLIHIRNNEWMNMKDLGLLLGMAGRSSPGTWCKNQGIDIALEAKRPGERRQRRIVKFAEVERALIGMLPQWFPLMHPELSVKYSQALCVFRKNELAMNYGTYTCIVEPVTTNQINIPLGSCTGNRFRSIFERHGFTEDDDSPIKVSTHQFRHYLNTLAQAGGLSELDIAKWSGRRDIRQNEAYDHLTTDQMLAKVQKAIGDSSEVFGPLAELPQNLPVSRDEFGRLRAPTAHTTDFGFCIHDYTMSPCELHRDCLHCRDHICVKGDPEKLKRLEDRLDDARRYKKKADDAVAEGYIGSDRWQSHHESTIDRLTQLVAFMHDSNVPNGAVIQLAPPQSPTKLAGRPSKIDQQHAIDRE